MNLQQYFDETAGLGILSSADNEGSVNSAVYSKPHFLEDGYLSFITHDKLTRHNLLANPSANYLFIENSSGYKGVRIYLEKVKEVRDDGLINALSKRKRSGSEDEAPPRFLVSFKVKKVLQLIGNGEISTADN